MMAIGLLIGSLLDAGVLSDPSWVMFGLTVLIGILGLVVLLFVYPFGRDD